MAHCGSRDEYTVGWVCPMEDDLTAAQILLDEQHQSPTVDDTEANVYKLGSIGDHNVVLASLPAGKIGANSAATLATEMKHAFPAIRFWLLVGVGGGVPGKNVDIRLGDVVVSHPVNDHGGVVQYDLGRYIPSGFKRRGFLNGPPAILLAAIMKLQSNQDLGRSSLTPNLSRLSKQPKFRHDQAGNDVLFEATYSHVGDEGCVSCASSKEIKRQQRVAGPPEVHYGTIASGNRVMRDGVDRDKVCSEIGEVLCFEMEAAGLMNNFPCLVIRGIGNYSDSHKNKRWQPYAAATAAAYTKELLLIVPVIEVVKAKKANQPSTDRMPYFSLPFLRNLQFIGRSSELHVLRQKLLIDKDCQRMAISGLGGIGKTQVALQFAYFVKENYPEFSILWLQAMNMETFRQGYMGIAQALGLHRQLEPTEDLKVLVQQRLCAKSAGKWLLFVDNLDDVDLLRGQGRMKGVLDMLPESDDCLTLFTTRHGAVAQHLVGSDVIELGKMTEEETMDMLERSLIRKTDSHGNKDMVDLLAELEYLPLAVTQAAAYINTNKSSISEYLSLFKNTAEDAIAIMSSDFGDKMRYSNLTNAVAKTWTITFNKIQCLDPIAANLLKFMSCIEWRAIPYSILPATCSKAQQAKAIGVLCSFSLIERIDHGTKFNMHRLVHLAIRIWVANNGQQKKIIMAAFKQLSAVFPCHYQTNHEKWREYMPHVAHIERYKSHSDSAERAELCLRVAKCLLVDERAKEATVWLRRSCEWRDKNLSPHNVQRLTSQRYLAMAYRQNGQLKESIGLFEYVVAISAGVLSEDDPDRLSSQSQLAISYQANGQTEESTKLLEGIVRI
ncbi:kinesin light chain [Penicillium waksmanii]|uniref:kinesin light chain n=1 Tax=Penicillium waksmanii TaxID=69791 RepID=UPI0025496A43|nr:kinesin light chain [Penicillium waksmanii]KAJ5987969.1 kinesin light chain [Penicillium waksmanii]